MPNTSYLGLNLKIYNRREKYNNSMCQKYIIWREPKDTEFVDHKPCLFNGIMVGSCMTNSLCPHQY